MVTIVILNPSDNLSNYEIAKKIATAGIFTSEKLLPEMKDYKLRLRVKIYSMRDDFPEEKLQDITNHILKFDEKHNVMKTAVIKGSITFHNCPELAKKLFGNYYTIA